MQLPPLLLESLKNTQGFDPQAFERIHACGQQVTSIRINPRKKIDIGYFGPGTSAVPWTEHGYYLDQRPSFSLDPLFHAGCYYVQEASGMFIEQALEQNLDTSRPLKVLDLCAAPGGKSTHILSLVSPGSLVVCNEVIRSRARTLTDNIIKWGSDNAIVTNNDPRDFGRLRGYFDVILTDVPCSGSGLFRRDPDAIEEWSPRNVELCSRRQHRILTDILPALRPGGLLIYSTCSYSKEEDEEVIDWLMEEYPIRSLSIGLQEAWNITGVKTSNEAYGYRFWPDKVRGEGFFMACAEYNGRSGAGPPSLKSNGFQKAALPGLDEWFQQERFQVMRREDELYAWRNDLVHDMSLISGTMRVAYCGIRLGQLKKQKFIPDHALAMSLHVSDAVVRASLDRDQAIRYLQKKDTGLAAANKGWQLVSHAGHALGWVNVLPNRINNYYPMELQILKDI